MRRLYWTLVFSLLLSIGTIGQAYASSFDIQWKHFPFRQLKPSELDIPTNSPEELSWNASEISWSPDGNQIVIGIENRYISIFDLHTERLKTLTELPLASTYLLPEWSPDGKLIAVAASQGVYIIEVATGEIRYSFPKSEKDTAIGRVKWMNDSRHILEFDYSGFIIVANIETGNEIKQIDVNPFSPTVTGIDVLDWSPNSNLFAARYLDYFWVWFWDENSKLLTQYFRQDRFDTSSQGCKLRQLSDGEGVMDFKWDGAGRTLAVATSGELEICTLNQDKTLDHRIIDNNDTRENLRTRVLWSSNGRWLLSSIITFSQTTNCKLQVFDRRQNYRLSQTLEDIPCFNSAVWSPDSKHIMAQNGTELLLGTVSGDN